ncbi:MAG: hypothetical protein R2834_04185 [Rhodothermales bacterium]
MLVFFFRFMYAGISRLSAGSTYAIPSAASPGWIPPRRTNSTFSGGLMVGRLMSVYMSRRYLPRRSCGCTSSGRS